MASGKGPRAGQAKRRAFTAAYKARIVQEHDQLQTGRERGALLRREGLYSSHITDWRNSRDAGAANGLAESLACWDAARRRWNSSGCGERMRNSPRS